MSRLILLAALVLTAASAQSQVYSGALEAGDAQLDSGEYLDEYAVTARAGQTVRAVVTSQAFDTYVIIKSASGDQAEDDDCTANETTRSCADFEVTEGGRVRVLVTSFAVGETGAYEVEITLEDGASRAPASGAEPGRLGPGDDTLETGEYADSRTIALEAGQQLSASMTSSDFDTYLAVIGPDGEAQENDDCTEGDFSRSCLEVVADRGGDYIVMATSYEPGETGRYQLALEVGEGGVGVARIAGRVETGVLEDGDATLDLGEFVDEYTVNGTGGSLVVDLRSDAFDTYVIVIGPDGQALENDDYQGEINRSLLVADTRDGEPYRVLVTSYAAGETGRYRLELRDEVASVTAGVRTESGVLEVGDEQLDAGEYVDRYTFEAVPGQRLRADLTSDVFDTYVALQTPSGQAFNDDDGGGRAGHSLLDLDLTEAGTYTVYVTSYAAAETGPYQLSLDLTERFGASSNTTENNPRSAAGALRLGFEQTSAGALDEDDQRLSSGEFTEVHTFDATAGQPVRVEMTSTDFDTYLIVRGPNGQSIDNDDFEGSQDTSVIEFVALEDGRYRVTATSYREGEVGDYEIRLTSAEALRPEPPAYDRIVGLFVGISEYDRMSGLRWTAEDAVIARDAMIDAGMAPGDGILLTDSEATSANVRDAFNDLALEADDRTLFVFFFSGHGGQYQRDAFERADPDGLDESLELYDVELLDNELDDLLTSLPTSRQLIVLDACYAGGFAKDVISRPGRMGLFSSEEDIVSAVAVKFEAGGYLSRFFADAVTERAADEDSNGAVTALELSHYLELRFTDDVQNDREGAIDMLETRDTRPEHQKLIVDRGSVGLYESLFVLRP